jgi:Ribbon-helix-helix protein, copG family
MVKCGEQGLEAIMGVSKAATKRTKPEPDTAGSIRATISFPPEQYATLEEIAKQKKVSLAWVVREAVDNYIGSKWPLFAKRT